VTINYHLGATMLIRVPNLLTCLLEVSKYHQWITPIIQHTHPSGALALQYGNMALINTLMYDSHCYSFISFVLWNISFLYMF
jgi:hypothetical protein